MASSRIFVRGLPPAFTEDDFRKHFSHSLPVTDAKLFPKRRIGYVGYKTPEDAAKAVKYFNKSYIRLSKIHVEPATPFSKESPEAPSAKPEKRDRQRLNADSTNEPQDLSSTTNPLKRKRTEHEHAPADPKLEEYLQVMGRPSKKQTWVNDDALGATTNGLALVDAQPAQVPQGDSDSDYEAVPKTSKKEKPEEKQKRISKQAASKENPNDERQASDEVVADAGQSENPQPSVEQQGISSDADWLRSRTSRLLGLAEDEDEDDEAQRSSLRPDEAELEVETVTQPRPNANAAFPEQNASAASDPDEDPTDGEPSNAEADLIRTTGRLFLRNLSYKISEDDLRACFTSVGQLEEVHVPLNPATGEGKGFAYVQFTNHEDAVNAYQRLDGTVFQGRLLHIIPASAKRTSKLDGVALSKLPLKKQNQIRKKMNAANTTFSWNSLYMNADAVLSSVSDRLGVTKSELLDPTSADTAVKQAQAETHVIQEVKAYFAEQGVDLDAFKRSQRGDTAILVKNFPYGTSSEELKGLFEEHGQVTRFLMPPSGTIAIVEFAQAPQARTAFATLAYRKIKDSVLFLEKAPKDLFSSNPGKTGSTTSGATAGQKGPKPTANDLLQQQPQSENIETSTLFVRNLNFTTTSERLSEIFKPLDGFISARVKTKPDPKRPGKTLSMGFGFLEFRAKPQAQVALSAMDGLQVDGHELQLKASHKGADLAEERRKEDVVKKAAARTTRIIIKNLPFQASKKDVRALLSSYGQLRSVRVPKKFDNTSRGFAFAEFVTPREAEGAMEALRNTHLLGRRLVLEFTSDDPEDAEAELEKMQKKARSQINKVALQKLTAPGRKKFSMAGNEDADEA